MVLEYVPYIILLAISPVAGEFFLRFAYPDIKTYIKARKWALFAAFGFAAYAPAAFLTLFEIVIPLYSPFGSSPVMFEYEGNTIVTVGLFIVILGINASIVDFAVARHKTTTVVGIPKHVIKYGIGKELVKTKNVRRNREVTKITHDLERVLSEEKTEKEVSSLLDKIRTSVQVAGAKQEREDYMMHHLEALSGPVGEPLGPEETKGFMSELGSIESLDESSKDLLKRKELPPGEESRKQPERDAIKERARLIAELEAKLKKAYKSGTETQEKTDRLLEELKQRVKEDIGEGGEEEVYRTSDIHQIAKALKDMKGEEKMPEIKHERRHGRHREEGEELSESLVEYGKSYSPRRGEDDLWKAVVGDVKQQLVEPRGETKVGRRKDRTKEAPKGSRWYDEGMEKTGIEAPIEQPENVELFEGDIMEGGEEMGESLGELGEGADIGDISDLESITQGLDTSEFDGMFVDVGETKGGCPNCGKKGTSVVYCSNCGKPLCSNCSKSVEGSESFIKYKCPHCGEEFAMKRRMPA